MDPNETLRRIRELAELIQTPTPDTYHLITWAGELAAQFTALDEWIKRHGFLPDDWTDGR